MDIEYMGMGMRTGSITHTTGSFASELHQKPASQLLLAADCSGQYFPGVHLKGREGGWQQVKGGVARQVGIGARYYVRLNGCVRCAFGTE